MSASGVPTPYFPETVMQLQEAEEGRPVGRTMLRVVAPGQGAAMQNIHSLRSIQPSSSFPQGFQCLPEHGPNMTQVVRRRSQREVVLLDQEGLQATLQDSV